MVATLLLPKREWRMAEEHRVIDVSVEPEMLPLSDLLVAFTLEGDDRTPKAFRMSLSVANQLADKIRMAIHVPQGQD
jgi:hypothetical protein